MGKNKAVSKMSIFKPATLNLIQQGPIGASVGEDGSGVFIHAHLSVITEGCC